MNGLTKVLRQQSNRLLCGVVDGARDLELAFSAKGMYDQQIHTLFDGEMAHALADVAPYAFRIELESGYLSHWESQFGNSSGILLTCSTTEVPLKHLRNIFVVEDESHQEFFFRFYDPRVLRPFLSTCSEQELREFFGPIETIFCESESSTEIVSYSVENSKLRTESFPFITH